MTVRLGLGTLSGIENRAWIGTPDVIVNRAAEWLAPFTDRSVDLIFRLKFPGMSLDQAAEQVRYFGSHVAPALRRLSQR